MRKNSGETLAKLRLLTRGDFAKIFVCAVLCAVAIVVVPALFNAANLAITDEICGKTLLASAKSPDGLHVAQIFEVDCGATTDFSTVVIVSEVERNANPNDDKDVVFRADGSQNVTLRWKSSTQLSLQSSQLTANDIFRRETQHDDIKISYF